MKNTFLKSTIILLIGGLITKLLGMFIKIGMARYLSTEVLGTYMLIIPTFTLLLSISQFGFPLAISKLISEESKSSKKILFSILPIIIIINIILIIMIILLAPTISNNLLHNSNTYYSIIAMSLVIPFTTISNICRSYFFGKQRMLPHVITNIIEELLRIIMIFIFLPYIIPYGIKITLVYLILINLLSEITSTILLILCLPKNIKITKSDLKPNKMYIKDTLQISIPNISSRLLGSFAYFLEPIIITTILSNIGYSMKYITHEYGIITGYVLPIIILPSFFTSAISQALLPVISKEYKRNNHLKVKRTIKKALLLSVIITLPISLFLLIKPNIVLKTIYHTTKGKIYIQVLSIVSILEYLSSPLTSILDSLNKSKYNLIASLIGTITRTISLILLSYLKIGLWSLIISIIISIITTTSYQLIKVSQYLNNSFI